MKVNKLALLTLLLVLFSATAAVAAENYVRKVDNFFILVDRSGSMDLKYVGTPDRKIVLAKSLLERMNAMIPELGYQGGLNTAAPARELQALEAYTTAGYGASLAKIPTLIGANPTPLGSGLIALESALQGAVGRNAVIVVSDGQENVPDIGTLKAAATLAEKYGVCFHTISFADTVNGNQALLDAITALKPCGVAASAAQLADDAALQKFVQDVFYETGAVDPCSLDDDGDGVNNCIDKCPDTLPGLAVDADGCPIADVVTLKVFFDFDKSDIKPQYHQELAEFASYMRQQQSFTVVEIAGHTDSIGTDEYNQKLSERRAKAVRDYLVNELGMDGNLFSAVGYGESQPIASNDTEEGRAKNRRIIAELKGVYKKK